MQGRRQGGEKAKGRQQDKVTGSGGNSGIQTVLGCLVIDRERVLFDTRSRCEARDNGINITAIIFDRFHRLGQFLWIRNIALHDLGTFKELSKGHFSLRTVHLGLVTNEGNGLVSLSNTVTNDRLSNVSSSTRNHGGFPGTHSCRRHGKRKGRCLL